MSGPKVSVYEMSARQRQNLRAQLNCLQQSMVCCEEIKKAVGYLNGLNGQIQSLLSTFNLINQRTGDCSSEISTLNNLQNNIPQECLSFMGQLSSSTPVPQISQIILTDAELGEKKEVLAKLRELRNKVVARQKDIEDALMPMEAKAKQGVSEVETAIAEDIAGVQSFFVLPAETGSEKFEAEKKRIDEQLRVLSLGNDCPANLKGEVLSASKALSRITTKERLNTFQAVTIQPLLNRIDVDRLQVLEQKSELEELQSRYTALCSVAGAQPEVFSTESGALEKIRDKVATLEKQIVMQTEQEYISECVNEVMAEMGYDIIGNRSVTKKSGKRFRNELYSYGDGTAINITYDSDGQIAIELGGIDRADRIPTLDETDVLREDMERLKAKGVLIKSRVAMAPPAAEYATIINISDYNITTASLVKEIATKGTRSKAAAKRILQKEDNR